MKACCSEERQLRERLLDACQASGADVAVAAQAVMNVLQVIIISASRDADVAEQNVNRVAADMLASIRTSFAEYAAAMEAQRSARH